MYKEVRPRKSAEKHLSTFVSPDPKRNNMKDYSRYAGSPYSFNTTYMDLGIPSSVYRD